MAVGNSEGTNMSQMRTNKTAQVNLKFHPDFKKLADRMAADDSRSLTSMIESLITNALRDRGYLSKDGEVLKGL